DGDLGGLGRDDEEGEHLTGVGRHRRALAVEGDEREVHRVEHDLDAHQQDEDIAADQEADAADREEERREGDVELDADPDAISLSEPAFGSESVWWISCLPRPRATATAPMIATMRSALESSNGTSPWLKRSLPMESIVPKSSAAEGRIAWKSATERT